MNLVSHSRSYSKHYIKHTVLVESYGKVDVEMVARLNHYPKERFDLWDTRIWPVGEGVWKVLWKSMVFPREDAI